MKKASRAVKAKKEENAYVDKNRYLGLCSYCKSAPNCTFVRDPSRPVCECDEFGGFTYTPVGIPDQRTVPPKHSFQKPLASEDPFSLYKGLCNQCEGRANCIYPKPEGGVWHCEEFR
jgi:hypothetical protein